MSLPNHERFGLDPAGIVSLFPDECSLTFGVAPCVASLTKGPGFQCHNTFETCQDKDNYDPEASEVIFANAQAQKLPISTIRGLHSWTTVASGIDQSRGLGGIGRVTFRFKDFPDPVDHLDPYRDRRPARIGSASFWTKFRARNRFYQNRFLELRTGHAQPDGTFNLGTFRVQKYVLEDIRILPGGEVEVVAKDVLKLLDRLKIPEATDGRLALAMDATQTSLTMQDGDGPQYASLFGEPSPTNPIFLRVDNEIFRCEARAGDVFSSLTRAAPTDPTGTTAATHAVGAKVQIVYHQELVRVDTIILDLLQRAGIPLVNIDQASFTDESQRWLTNHNFRLYLSRSTTAAQLVRDLLQACNSYIWWNAELQAVQFRHIRPRTPDETAPVLDGRKQFEKDSISVEDLNDRRITRASYFFGLKDWSQDFRNRDKRDELFEVARVIIDQTAESVNAYGDEVEEEVVAYMAPATLAVEMAALAFRRVSRNVNPPRRVRGTLVAREAYELTPPDFRDLLIEEIVDFNGVKLQTECFVVSKKLKSGNDIRYETVFETTNLDEKWWFFAENTTPTFDLATDEQKKTAFFADANCEIVEADGTVNTPYLFV